MFFVPHHIILLHLSTWSSISFPCWKVASILHILILFLLPIVVLAILAFIRLDISPTVFRFHVKSKWTCLYIIVMQQKLVWTKCLVCGIYYSCWVHQYYAGPGFSFQSCKGWAEMISLLSFSSTLHAYYIQIYLAHDTSHSRYYKHPTCTANGPSRPWTKS